MDLDKIQERNLIASQDKYLREIEAREKTRSDREVIRIGDRDPNTGKYQSLHLSGTPTTDGVKTFTGASNQQVVRSLNPFGSNSRALDSKNFVQAPKPVVKKKKKP